MNNRPNQSTGSWQRYYPEVVLEFGVPVVAVDRKGKGRLTTSQNLICGELFCYLPPLPQSDRQGRDQ